MQNVARHLRRACKIAIERSYPMVNTARETFRLPVYDKKHSCYRIPYALGVEKAIKEYSSESGEKSIATADEISRCLASKIPSEFWDREKTKHIKNGLFEVHLSASFVSSAIKKIVSDGVFLPDFHVASRQRVVVDFSSPNVAKELHVGHLRSTVIGESLCRILEFAGHEVIRLNHVGDWGTPMGMIIAHVADQNGDSTSQGEAFQSVCDLQRLYKEAQARYKEDEAFQQRALASVVRLQRGDAAEMQVWKAMCKVSQKAFLDLYRRLDVTITERGESFYRQFIPEVMEWLKEKGVLQTDEKGRQVMHVKDKPVPLILQKSDGAYTYDMTDLTALWHRVHHVKADRIIYVVDYGQNVHFQTLFEGACQADIFKGQSVELEHAAFGLMQTKDGKRMRTRAGESVRLTDLLDESMERVGKLIEKKGLEKAMSQEEVVSVQEAIAYGCVRYFDLLRHRLTSYIFSFDDMLDPKGNTAIYLLYAYARMRSISRLVNVSHDDIKTIADQTTVSLKHPTEWKLACFLLTFPETVEMCTSQLCTHYLCGYLYELSSLFTRFYRACYVVDTNPATKEVLRVHESRVLLCHAVAEVMEKGFCLLGIRPVEQM